MNKEMVLAKIRCWQAEVGEMVATLTDEGKTGPILDILQKRHKALDELIEAIQDQSFIQPGDVRFEPKPVMDEIEGKMKKVKEGVKKLKKLSDEKNKIINKLEKEE